MAKKITLVCESCLSRNYHTHVNEFSKNRLELKKFCKSCNCPTLHKETR